MHLFFRVAVSLVVAFYMSIRSVKRRSLSVTGAGAAFVAGAVHMTCGWTFGAVLIMFYLTSSQLTRLKQEKKAALDESFQISGQRSFKQVFCTSFGGAVAAVIAFSPAVMAPAYQAVHVYEREAVLRLLAWSAFLGHYSCCCADTWASELGMLSESAPRLITTLKPVPPGVNGAVTARGLTAAAAGGLCMAAGLWLVGTVTGELRQIAPLVASMAQQHLPVSNHTVVCQAAFWLLLGLCSGLGGSLVDSVLGATVQYSGYSHKSCKVVSHAGPHVQHISGLPWLSNEAVNAVSAAVTSIVAACGVAWLLE